MSDGTTNYNPTPTPTPINPGSSAPSASQQAWTTPISPTPNASNTPQQQTQQQTQQPQNNNNSGASMLNAVGQGHQIQNAMMQMQAQGATAGEAAAMLAGQYLLGNTWGASGNYVHEVSASVDGTTDYFTMFSKDKGDEFFNNAYDRLQSSGQLMPLLQKHGILSNSAETDLLNSLQSTYNQTTLSNQQLQDIVATSSFVVPTYFDQTQQNALKNIAATGNASDIKKALVAAGVNASALPNDLVGLQVIANNIANTGVHNQRINVSTSTAGKAGAVLREREHNREVLNGYDHKKRGTLVREIRQGELKALQKLAPGFDGSKRQLDELKHMRSDGKFQFKDSAGTVVVVDRQTRDQLLNFGNTFGTKEEIQDSINHSKGRLATVLMDNDMKSGYHFSVTTMKASASAGRIAYRAAASLRDNSFILGAKLQLKGNQLTSNALTKGASKLVQTGAAHGIQLTGPAANMVQKANALKADQQNINDSIDALKQLKKDRKDVIQISRQRRAAKIKGGEKLKSSKISYRDAKFQMKAKYLDAKQDIYKSRHGGKTSDRIKKKQSKLVKKNDKRIKREKWLADTKQNFSNSWIGKALSKVASPIKKILDPLAAVKRMFNKLKKKIIIFIGKAMIYFLGWYGSVALMFIFIALIASFFSFAFIDKTNYGQLLIMDMQDVERAFVKVAKRDTLDYFRSSERYGSKRLAEEESIPYDKKGITIEDGVETEVRKLYTYENNHEMNNLGSYIPYFGLASRRYQDEIGNDLYGTLRGYMQYLFIGSHGIQEYDYDMVKVYYCDDYELGSCNNVYYHNGGSWLKNKMPSDSKGECSHFELEYRQGDLKCGRKEHLKHLSSCYYYATVYYTKSDGTEGTRQSKRLSCGYGGIHRHKPWNSKEDPGCYHTDEWRRCEGHCAGHVVPLVDLYSKVDLRYIASTDGQLSPMFNPPHALEKNTDWLKEAKTNSVKTWLDWEIAWGTKFASEYPNSLINKWNDNKYKAASITVAKDYENMHKTFPFEGWTISDFEYVEGLIGSIKSQYVEGFEMWEGFEVYFPDDFITKLTPSEYNKWTEDISAEYPDSFQQSTTSSTLLNTALLNLGDFYYDINAENSSLDYINYVLNECINPSATEEEKVYWTFEDFKDISHNVNKSIGWGNAETYKDLLPGSLLLDTENEILSIYVGTYDGKFHIIDCSPYAGTSAIRYLGWEEMNRRYTKTVPHYELNSISEFNIRQ